MESFVAITFFLPPNSQHLKRNILIISICKRGITGIPTFLAKTFVRKLLQTAATKTVIVRFGNKILLFLAQRDSIALTLTDIAWLTLK